MSRKILTDLDFVGATRITGLQSPVASTEPARRADLIGGVGVVNLTDAPSIAVDATLGSVFTVTLAGNRTLANPTGATAGQKLLFRVKQDAAGGRTLAFDTKFRFGTDLTAVALTTAGGKTDYIGVIYHAIDDRFDVVALQRGF